MCVRIVTVAFVLEKSALAFAVAILIVILSASNDNGFSPLASSTIAA